MDLVRRDKLGMGLSKVGLEAPLPLWNAEVEKVDMAASLVTGNSSSASAYHDFKAHLRSWKKYTKEPCVQKLKIIYFICYFRLCSLNLLLLFNFINVNRFLLSEYIYLIRKV